MGITSYFYSTRSSLPKWARFTHYKVQEMYHWLLWRSAVQGLGHNVGRVVIVPPITKLLMSKFADGKNIQFTNHRPSISCQISAATNYRHSSNRLWHPAWYDIILKFTELSHVIVHEWSETQRDCNETATGSLPSEYLPSASQVSACSITRCLP